MRATNENSIMKYNAETTELICFAPPGEEILRVDGVSFFLAHTISNAIQAAYNKGNLLGRLELQHSLERFMDASPVDPQRHQC